MLPFNEGEGNRRYNYEIFRDEQADEYAAISIKDNVVDDEASMDSSMKTISETSKSCNSGDDLGQKINQYLKGGGTFDHIRKLFDKEVSFLFCMLMNEILYLQKVILIFVFDNRAQN